MLPLSVHSRDGSGADVVWGPLWASVRFHHAKLRGAPPSLISLYKGTSLWYTFSQSEGSCVLGTLSERQEDHYGSSASAALLHHLRAAADAWRCLLCRLWHADKRTINGYARLVFCRDAIRRSTALRTGTNASAR